MRRLLVPLALLLALAACSEDGRDGDGDRDDGGSSKRSDADLATSCDALGDDEASALLGFALTRKDSDLPGGVSCTYFGADDSGYLNVVVVDEDASFETLYDLVGSPEDVTSEPIDVPGSEEALLVDDRAGSLPLTSVVARGDGEVFTVYPTGLTREDEVRIAVGALTVLLGGEPDPTAAVDRGEVPLPCDLVTEAEAQSALGLPVTATRLESGSVRACDYTAGDVVVTLFDNGAEQRVDQAAAGLQEPPEQIEAPPPLTAFASPEPEEGLVLAVATDVTVLRISVEGADPVEARRLAEALLPALVP